MIEAESSNHPLGERRKILSQPTPPDDPGDKATAQAEEQQLERASGQHKRAEIARKILSYSMWVLMIVVFTIIASAIFTLGFHLLAPIGWHWLDDPEIQDVKDFVLSGAVVGLGTTYIRRYLENE